MGIEQTVKILAYTVLGALLLFGIFLSIRKAVKSDRASAKGVISAWLYTAFCVVEAFFSAPNSGTLKFEAVKRLVLQNEHYPEEIKRFAGTPEFETRLNAFIEANFKKAQAVWIEHGKHKPLDK